MYKIDEKYKEYFPTLEEQFQLRPFQIEVIDNVCKNGNTLCVMPTGGGKSLIYWMTGMILGGVTIVISPLIALIDEQSDKLRSLGIEVLTIHGGISSDKQAKLLIDFANKRYNPKFIFVSPEKIATDGLFEHCMKKRKEEISLFAIDEVHCVSQWGMSFRPFYKRIPEFLLNIFESEEQFPKVLALTATINPKETLDICNEFLINQKNIIKSDFLIRTEISLKVLKFITEEEKEDKFWDIVNIHKNEKILAYVYRINSERGVIKLAERAIEKGYKATFFHGDLSAKERQEIIKKYKNDEINIIFATNAFGMGIDIPDIRTVIHFMIPESVEQYYQEIGRAARDKKAANAYLLYSNKNLDVKRRYFIEGSFPTEEKLKETYENITKNKIGLQSLPFFENEDTSKCFQYFIESNLLKVECKGFSTFKCIKSTSNQKLEEIMSLTRIKSLISSFKKSSYDIKDIVEMTYEGIINGDVILSKAIDRRLVIDVNKGYIENKDLTIIKEDINIKKSYKHDLLDYLVYLIDESNDSNRLHQEIGNYLGLDKHKLGRIYSTLKGDKVRSKSEVIIANLLYENGIGYEYEKKVFYSDDKWIEPDFTIKIDEEDEIYWEHLGMLGLETYDERWSKKLHIYDIYFKDKLVTTYEGSTISDSAYDVIQKLKV